MKNNEIHNGLPNKEIRDFLSLQLGIASGIEYKMKVVPADIKNGLDRQIFRNNESIAYSLKNNEKMNALKALYAIIEMLGYGEYDVSDSVENVGNNWLSFIGTEEEYETLLKQLNK